MNKFLSKTFYFEKTSYLEIKQAFLNFEKKSSLKADSKRLIVFEELILNILKHNSQSSMLYFRLKQKKDHIFLLIVDEGILFNLVSYQQKKADGIGLLLIHRFSRKIFYKRYQQKNYTLLVF